MPWRCSQSASDRCLELRFGLVDGKDHTLEEVGQYFEVTRERIRQIEAKALRSCVTPPAAGSCVIFCVEGLLQLQFVKFDTHLAYDKLNWLKANFTFFDDLPYLRSACEM